MLRSIGKQSGESVESVMKKEIKATVGRICRKGMFELGVEEWAGVMDDESGESMEPMEEVPLKVLGESELERLVRGWRRGAGSWFQRRREAYWKEGSVIRREDYVDDERVWPKMKRECCEEAELWWGYADMKVGWLWELCRQVKGARIRCARLFWKSLFHQNEHIR